MPLQPTSLLGLLLLGGGIAWFIREFDIERRKGPLEERREVERAFYAEDWRVWGGRLKVTTLVGSAALIIIGIGLITLDNIFQF